MCPLVSLGIESTRAGLSWVLHWRGLELGWELCCSSGGTAGARIQRAALPNRESQIFVRKQSLKNDFILKTLVDFARSEVIQVRYCRRISVEHAAVQKRRLTGLGTLPTTAHRVHTVQPWLPKQVLNGRKSWQKLTRAPDDFSRLYEGDKVGGRSWKEEKTAASWTRDRELERDLARRRALRHGCPKMMQKNRHGL